MSEHEPRWIIHETYPGGHEMRHNWYGPATEAEFRAGTPVQDENSRRTGESFQGILDIMASSAADFNRILDPVVPSTVEQEMDTLFRDGEYNGIDGEYLALEPYKEWVLVVRWSEPEDDVAVYGPYHTQEEAEANISRIEPQFVNPFSSQQELEATLSDSDPHQVRTAKQCGDMGFEFGGELPDDVVFEVKRLNALWIRGAL